MFIPQFSPTNFQGNKVPPEELSQAEEKLQESLDVADSSMFNLLSGDVSLQPAGGGVGVFFIIPVFFFI